MKARLLTVLLVLSCVSVPAVETYEFESWAVGAVGFGWAGFGAALAGPGEYLINPAGLGNALRTEIAGTYVPAFEDRLTPCFGASFIKPMRTESASLGEERTFGTLAVSLYNADDSNYWLAQYNPRSNWTYKTDSLACVSFGSRANDLLAYGLNLKVLAVEKDGRADSGFGLDLGVQLYPGDFRVGLAVSNLIPPGISLRDERSYTEQVVRLGSGYSLEGVLNLAAELEYALSTDRLDYGLCAEVVPLERDDFRIALGGGYRALEKLWGGFLSLRVGPFEAACAVQLDVSGFTTSCLRFSFSPDI